MRTRPAQDDKTGAWVCRAVHARHETGLSISLSLQPQRTHLTACILGHGNVHDLIVVVVVVVVVAIAAPSCSAGDADGEKACSGVHEVADLEDDAVRGDEQLDDVEARSRPVGVSSVPSCAGDVAWE